MLIETHCHLLDGRFDSDREDALNRARASGITRFVEVACEPAQWQKALDFTQEHADIFCSIGLHPHEAKLADEKMLDEIQHLISKPKVVALGEAGLDYYYNHSEKSVQKDIFIKQISIAVKTNKPLIVHARDAYDDLRTIFEKTKCYEKTKCAIHCFSGSRDDMKYFLERGFLFGIDGPVTFPSAVKLAETVKEIPLNAILLESDSPYLAPQSKRGGRNEPANLTEIAQKVAAIKAISFDEVAAATSNNAGSFFGL